MKHRYNLLFIQLMIIFCFDNLHITLALLGDQVVPAHDHDLAFVASIAYDDDRFTPAENHFCTGTLISERHVLTAKICVENISKIHRSVVHIGCPSLQSCKKYDWQSFDTYATWSFTNRRQVDNSDDVIAVIQLIEKVRNVRSAMLYSHPVGVRPGAKLYMAGWGQLQNDTRPNDMQKVSVKVLLSSECQSKVNKFVPFGFYDWDKKICTKASSGYAILSREDVGGPIFDQEKRVVGINLGVAPDVNVIPEVKVNIHGTVSFYRDFLSNFYY